MGYEDKIKSALYRLDKQIEMTRTVVADFKKELSEINRKIRLAFSTEDIERSIIEEEYEESIKALIYKEGR